MAILREYTDEVSDDEYATRLKAAREASTLRADQRREHQATPRSGSGLSFPRRGAKRSPSICTGGDNIRDLGGLDAPVGNGDKVAITPAIAGD